MNTTTFTNSVTFILGAQGTGKTTEAINLCQGKPYTEVYSHVRGMDSRTKKAIIDGQIIIVEEVDRINTFLKQLISTTTFRLRAPYAREAKDYPRPPIIVISNVLTEADLKGVKGITGVLTLPAK